MKKLLTILMLSLLLVSCGTGPNSSTTMEQADLLIGQWVLYSYDVNGEEYDNLPFDTIVHNADMTGSNITTIGWGSYDFTYSVNSKSLIYTIVLPEKDLFVDSMTYYIRHDTLTQIRVITENTIGTKKLIKIID